MQLTHMSIIITKLLVAIPIPQLAKAIPPLSLTTSIFIRLFNTWKRYVPFYIIATLLANQTKHNLTKSDLHNLYYPNLTWPT